MKSFRLYSQLFFLFSMVATILLIPIASNTHLPNMIDFFNHMAIITQAHEALLDGQFPLRVAPSDLAGFQYPLFQFYSPTSYTIAALIYQAFTSSNPFIAYKITLWSCLVCGGFFIFHLAYKLTQNKSASIFASVAYLTTPFMMISINHIASFNETIAMSLQPLVIYCTLSCYSSIDLKKTLQTALLWYLLATIHLITFVTLSCSISIFIFLLAIQRVQPPKNMVNVLIVYLFGCFLAAWFLGPIQLLANHLSVIRSFNYYLRWQSIIHLFSPLAHISITEKDSALGIHPSIGWPLLFGIGICFYMIVFEYRSKKTAWITSLFILFFINFFLIWSPLNIWKYVPDFIKVVQYNWRLLNQLSWIGSLLLTYAICRLLESKIKPNYIYIGIGLLLLTTFVWLPIKEVTYVPINSYSTSTISDANSNYLMDVDKSQQWIQYVDAFPKQENLFILPFKEVRQHCIKIKNNIRCIISVPSMTKIMELPLFYYPNLLTITINGHPAPYIGILHDYYLIAGIIPEAGQVNIIEFQFRGWLLANYISSMSWMLWLILLIYLILKRIQFRSSASIFHSP